MPYFIGVDEAGYGPNLGPLVIAATAWKVPDSVVDLRAALEPFVARTPSSSNLAIGDSKQIHQANQSLGVLEHHTLTALSPLLIATTQRFRRLWQHELRLTLPETKQGRLAFMPTIADNVTIDGVNWPERFYFDPSTFDLPLHCDAAAIANTGQRWQHVLDANKIQLCDVRFILIFPQTFNRYCDYWSSKGAALSWASLSLAAKISQTLPDDDLQIVCDKHGGRDDYRHWLQQTWSPAELLTELQSEEISRYAWQEPRRRVQIAFQAKGESFLPTALASMTAKYLREVAMEQWNRFWLQPLPHLKPTKGYPTDARRFLAEIRDVQQQLGIPLDTIWRNK
jgi:ribonuclease HII